MRMPFGCASPVLAVTGLRAEAKIAAGEGVKTVAGGGDAARLASLLQEGLAAGGRAVISFGIAGGLAPSLRAGTIVVADAVDDGQTRWTTNAIWRARLLEALPTAVRGGLAGVDGAIVGPLGKAALHRRSGALAVDMESHVAARLAALHRVPFAALRVVADSAERSLPEAAIVGMRPDGTIDVCAVIRALTRRPKDLPTLIQTALDARVAFAALSASRNRLSARLGFRDQSSDPVRAPGSSPEEPAGSTDPFSLAKSAVDSA